MTERTSARGPWVLSLDVGSSSARAVLFDAGGRPLGGVARVEYGWRTGGGAMEMDAEPLVACCVEVLDRAVERARAAGVEIAAVAAATFWHGVMGVAADGRAATPLFGWGDSRGPEAAVEMASRLDAEAYHRRTGCWLHPTYPASRLLWLQARAGDSLPRATAWMSIGELLLLRFFGEARSSLSMASGTGLFQLRGCAWDGEALAAAGVPAESLPPVSDEPLRGLRAEWARRWPELARVPWFPALGDGACASLGSGAFGPGRIGLTVGTSAAVRVLHADAEPEAPPGLWCYRLDAGRTVTGRALSNGGNAFAWLTATLSLPAGGELDAALEALPPDGHGLTVGPVLVPERPPARDPDERASIHGLTLATTPLQIARAWLEAAAFRIASAAWTRIVADVLGRPVRLPAVEEETARGAALVALERLGAVRDLAEAAWIPTDAMAPDAERHAVYRAARARPLPPRPPLPITGEGLRPSPLSRERENPGAEPGIEVLPTPENRRAQPSPPQ